MRNGFELYVRPVPVTSTRSRYEPTLKVEPSQGKDCETVRPIDDSFWLWETNCVSPFGWSTGMIA